MADASTSVLQGWIDRMNAGDPSAWDQLIAHSCERLRRLAKRMLREFPRVGRWEDADDVLQNAGLRLLKWKPASAPANTADFFRLTTRIIRNELLDLKDHYYGPQGSGTRHETPVPQVHGEATPPQGGEAADSTNEPGRLAGWGDFHRCVEELPDDERDVVDLLWYQELTRAEAASVLAVAEITVRRRWMKARLLLQKALGNDGPFR